MGTDEREIDMLERGAATGPRRLRRRVGRRVGRSPPLLQPLEPDAEEYWTVFGWPGISTSRSGSRGCWSPSPPDGQPGRHRSSFFIFPRRRSRTVVYGYAYTMVAGKKPSDMPDVLRETFAKRSRSRGREARLAVGPGYTR